MVTAIGKVSKFETVFHSYWEYFLELEVEVASAKRFVAFEKDNFGTYSSEFLRVYQATCSEVEVVAKALAQTAREGFNPKDATLHKCWFAIQDECRFNQDLNSCARGDKGVLLCDASVTFADRFELQPWKGYAVESYVDKLGARRLKCREGSANPRWWMSYNKVKHHRVYVPWGNRQSNYSEANLGNVISALSALYVLEIALLATVGKRDELESFVDKSLLFAGRDRYLSSRDIDEILGGL